MFAFALLALTPLAVTGAMVAQHRQTFDTWAQTPGQRLAHSDMAELVTDWTENKTFLDQMEATHGWRPDGKDEFDAGPEQLGRLVVRTPDGGWTINANKRIVVNGVALNEARQRWQHLEEKLLMQSSDLIASIRSWSSDALSQMASQGLIRSATLSSPASPESWPEVRQTVDRLYADVRLALAEAAENLQEKDRSRAESITSALERDDLQEGVRLAT